MTKFKISNTVNWIDINMYIAKGESVSVDKKIKLEKHTSDFVLFSHKKFNEVFCFPIYNDTIFNNIKDDSDIILGIRWKGKKSKLIFALENEHDIRILSYGIRVKDEPKNINNIKNWLSKQLI